MAVFPRLKSAPFCAVFEMYPQILLWFWHGLALLYRTNLCLSCLTWNPRQSDKSLLFSALQISNVNYTTDFPCKWKGCRMQSYFVSNLPILYQIRQNPKNAPILKKSLHLIISWTWLCEIGFYNIAQFSISHTFPGRITEELYNTKC